jgi:hypothetical protein
MRSVRNTARNLGTHLAVVGQKHLHQRLHQPSLCSGGHLVTVIYQLMLSLLMAKEIPSESRRFISTYHVCFSSSKSPAVLVKIYSEPEP